MWGFALCPAGFRGTPGLSQCLRQERRPLSLCKPGERVPPFRRRTVKVIQDTVPRRNYSDDTETRQAPL